MQKKSTIFLLSGLALATATVSLCKVLKCPNKCKLTKGLNTIKNKFQFKPNTPKIIPCSEKYEWKAEDPS